MYYGISSCHLKFCRVDVYNHWSDRKHNVSSQINRPTWSSNVHLLKLDRVANCSKMWSASVCQKDFTIQSLHSQVFSRSHWATSYSTTAELIHNVSAAPFCLESFQLSRCVPRASAKIILSWASEWEQMDCALTMNVAKAEQSGSNLTTIQLVSQLFTSYICHSIRQDVQASDLVGWSMS